MKTFKIANRWIHFLLFLWMGLWGTSPLEARCRCPHHHRFDLRRLLGLQENFNLQRAIDNAQPGGIIEVPGGRFDGPFTINKSLTLIGELNAKEQIITMLDGGNRFRVLEIIGNKDHDTIVTLKNLIIQNGRVRGENGGGILNTAHLHLLNVQVLNNEAFSGGGIYNDHGSFKIVKSKISFNVATPYLGSPSEGGGIATNSDSSENEIVNSEILFNQADKAAGLSNIAGQLTIKGSKINLNEAILLGGGLVNQGRLILNSSQVNSNRVQNSGRAIGGGLVNQGTLILNESEVNINRVVSLFANAEGGGIFNGSKATLNNSRVEANQAVSIAASSKAKGGGIFNEALSETKLNNTEVQNNRPNNINRQ